MILFNQIIFTNCNKNIHIQTLCIIPSSFTQTFTHDSLFLPLLHKLRTNEIYVVLKKLRRIKYLICNYICRFKNVSGYHNKNQTYVDNSSKDFRMSKRLHSYLYGQYNWNLSRLSFIVTKTFSSNQKDITISKKWDVQLLCIKKDVEVMIAHSIFLDFPRIIFIFWFLHLGCFTYMPKLQ